MNELCQPMDMHNWRLQSTPQTALPDLELCLAINRPDLEQTKQFQVTHPQLGEDSGYPEPRYNPSGRYRTGREDA